MDARSMFEWKFNENNRRLRTNLESIIAKYDQPFDGDDEVDISSMSIFKDRGQIRKRRPKSFGHCKLAAGKARDKTYLLSGCEDSALGSSETAHSFASVDTTFQDNILCSQPVKREPGLELDIRKPDLTCIQDDVLCNLESEPSDAETISSTSSESEDDLDSDTSCSDTGVASDIDDDNPESTDTAGGVCSGSEALESDCGVPQLKNNQARKAACNSKGASEGHFFSDKKLVDLSAVTKLQRRTTDRLEPSPRLGAPNSGMTDSQQTERQGLRNCDSDCDDNVTLLMDDLTTSSGIDTRPKLFAQSWTEQKQCLATNNLTFVVEQSKDRDSTHRLQCSSSELRLHELQSLRVSGTSERPPGGSLDQSAKSKRDQVGKPLVWKLGDANSRPLVLRPGKTDVNQNIQDMEDLNIGSAASFPEDSVPIEQPCNVSMTPSGLGDSQNAVAAPKDDLSTRSCTPKRKAYMPDVPRYSNEDFLEILSSPGPITGPGTDPSSVEKDISNSFKKLTQNLQLSSTAGTQQFSVPASLSQDTLAQLKQRTSVPKQPNRWATSVPARLFTQNLMAAPVSGHGAMFSKMVSPHREMEDAISPLETNTPCLPGSPSLYSDPMQSSKAQGKLERGSQSPCENLQRHLFARRATSPSVLFAQLKLQSPAQSATERVSTAGTQSCVPRVRSKRSLFQNPTADHHPISANKRDEPVERTPKIKRGNTGGPRVNSQCRVRSLPSQNLETVRPVQPSAKQPKHDTGRGSSYSPVELPETNARLRPPRRVVPTALPASVPREVDSDCEMLPPQGLVVKPKTAALPTFHSPMRLDAEALRKHTMQNKSKQSSGVLQTYLRKKGANHTSTPTKQDSSPFDITSISSIDCFESVPDTVSVSDDHLESSDGSSSTGSTVLEHMKPSTRSRKILSDTSSDDLSESSEDEAPRFLSITPKVKLSLSKGHKFSKKERSPPGHQLRSPSHSHTRAELVRMKERVTFKVLKSQTNWVSTSEEDNDDDYIPRVASEPRHRQRLHHRRLNLSATARKDSPKRPRESDSDVESKSRHDETLKHTPKRMNMSGQNSMVCLGPGRCWKSFCFNCMTS